MRDVGFTLEEIDSIVGVLAIVLHIGNMTFIPNDSDFAQISSLETLNIRLSF